MAAPGFWLTIPPPTSEKFSSGKKNEIYQRGLNLAVEFRCVNFFWPLTPPPPSRYSINQPLSKGPDSALLAAYLDFRVARSGSRFGIQS